MKTKFSGILTLLLAFVVQLTFAQTKTVSGTIIDGSGLPIPGATILVKGTSIGTASDFDGNFSIKADQGATLVFSFVGYITQEIVIGTSNTINVTLEEDLQSLDEVLIVGYGTSTKQAFTGSVKEIKSGVLESKTFANVSQALTGEVAGVNVINTSGQPGTVATVRIRGFGSVNGNRDPLYVVDGVPLTTGAFESNGDPINNGSLNSINPADIESATVLKDATATAIYGARGANGVILITTKSGKAGTSNIEVDVKTGINFQAIPRYDVIKNPNEYVELSWLSLKNRAEVAGNNGPDYANANLFGSLGIPSSYNYFNTTDVTQIIDPATGKVRPGIGTLYTPENWEDYAFQSSYLTEGNLKMSGGNDKTKYFSSFGYLDQDGYINNSSYKRYSARLNLSHKPKDWVTATANLNYSYDETLSNGQSEDSGSVFWFVDNIPSIYPLFLRDANGNKVEDPYYGGHQYDYGGDYGRGFGLETNAVADAKFDRDGNNRHSINSSFSLKFDITQDLTFETRYGFQYYNRIRSVVNNPFYGSAAGQNGSLYKTATTEMTQNLLNIARYSKSFGDHSIEVLAAHETNKVQYDFSGISKQNVVNLENGLDQANNYVVVSSPPFGYNRKRNLESYFGQVNYNFGQKYYLTGSVRRDGSSRFYQKKWGTFGSVGASWVLSSEDFLVDSSKINFLKLKASYGLVGDEAGVQYYSGQNAYDIENLLGEISLIPRPIQDVNLTWETSKMFQTGIELSAFNNIIDLSLDYYIKNTDDLIFDKRLSPSSSEALITVNDGKLVNKGLEFDLTAKIINKKDFGLNFSINGEVLDNELTQMPIEESTGLPKALDQNGNYGRSVGHSLFDFYMREWAGVDPDNGNPLWNQYYFDSDNNNTFDPSSGDEAISNLTQYQLANPNNTNIKSATTSIYANATDKYVGKSAIPDVRGAFRLNARIKNFDISTQFTYSIGGYAYDGAYASLMNNSKVGSANWHTDIRNSWREPGDITDVPAMTSAYNTQVNTTSTRFLTSTDYLAFNNASIGYTFPSKFIANSGLTGLNVFLSGDNLFISSNRKGFNPNTDETGTSNTYRYAPLTTVTLGVRVKF